MACGKACDDVTSPHRPMTYNLVTKNAVHNNLVIATCCTKRYKVYNPSLLQYGHLGVVYSIIILLKFEHDASIYF